MRKTKEIRAYHFDNEDAPYLRKAEIIFKRTTEPKMVMWDFIECNFTTAQTIYSKHDWDFLRAIANKIDEIYKELAKEEKNKLGK